MNRGWSSLYSRASSRRSLMPPPDYSGVLFDNPAEHNVTEENLGETNALPEPQQNKQNQTTEIVRAEENAAQPGAERRVNPSEGGVTLPLPVPKLRGFGDNSPRFPLFKRKNKKYTFKESCPLTRPIKEKPKTNSGANPLAGLLENAGFDDLLLAALILMMLECGAERIMILLLGILLI